MARELSSPESRTTQQRSLQATAPTKSLAGSSTDRPAPFNPMAAPSDRTVKSQMVAVAEKLDTIQEEFYDLPCSAPDCRVRTLSSRNMVFVQDIPFCCGCAKHAGLEFQRDGFTFGDQDGKALTCPAVSPLPMQTAPLQSPELSRCPPKKSQPTSVGAGPVAVIPQYALNSSQEDDGLDALFDDALDQSGEPDDLMELLEEMGAEGPTEEPKGHEPVVEEGEVEVIEPKKRPRARKSPQKQGYDMRNKCIDKAKKQDARRTRRKHRRGSIAASDHGVLHLPTDPDSRDWCLQAKMQAAPKKAPDQVVSTEKKATAPGNKWHTDCFGPTEPSVHGETHGIIYRCDLSKSAKCAALQTTVETGLNSEDTRSTYTALIIAETKEHGPVEICRSDGGPEYRGSFEVGLKDDKTTHEPSLVHKPSTNAGVERYIRITIGGARVTLLASGLPYVFWAYAFVMFLRNWNLGGIHPEHNVCPWKLFRPNAGEVPRAVPSGCLAWYIEPLLGARKFDAKANPGVVLTYGGAGSLHVLDKLTYDRSGQIRVVQTRDVAVKANIFPFAAERIGVNAADISLKSNRLMTARQTEDALEILNGGADRCKPCQLSPSTDPLTCKTCQNPKSYHKTHKKDAGCRKGRCGGHTKKQVVDFMYSREQDGQPRFPHADDLLFQLEDQDIITAHQEGTGGDAVPLDLPPAENEQDIPAMEHYRVRIKNKEKTVADRIRVASTPPKTPSGSVEAGAGPVSPRALDFREEGSPEVIDGSPAGGAVDFAIPQDEDEDPLEYYRAAESVWTEQARQRDERVQRQAQERKKSALAATGHLANEVPIYGTGLFNKARIRRGADGSVKYVDAPFGMALTVMPPFRAEADSWSGPQGGPTETNLVDFRMDEQFEQELKAERRATPEVTYPPNEGMLVDSFTPYAAVSKVIPMNSTAAKTPEARRAIEKERDNIEQRKKVWDLSKAIPAKKVTGKSARFLWVHLIMGVKHWEQDAAKHVYKVRIVAGGHRILDRWGAQAAEDGLFTLPIGLPILRLLASQAMVRPGWIAAQFDFDGAYLQAPRTGPPVYARPHDQLLTEELRQMPRRGEDPVVPLDFWPYGEPTAGDNCNAHMENEIGQEGWARVDSTSNATVYTR